MAPLSPAVRQAMRNYALKSSVEDLKLAYVSALNGLVHRENEIETTVRHQLGLGPDDEFPDPDPSDPDDPVGLLYEQAGEQDSQAKRGAPLVRHAFLIALFHLWERHCNASLVTSGYSSTSVNAMLESKGHHDLCLPIKHLQLAANCAKHGPGNSGSRLYKECPELFPAATSAEKANEKTLLISDDTLRRFFQAIHTASQ